MSKNRCPLIAIALAAVALVAMVALIQRVRLKRTRADGRHQHIRERS